MLTFQPSKATQATPSVNHLDRATSRPPSCSVTFNRPAAAEISPNHVIQSLCKKGDLRRALSLLSQEPNPTQRTYELLLLSCSHKNSLSNGISVHRHLSLNGFDQDPFLATKLINMYSEQDDVQSAREVFDEIRDRTIFVWNALFRALTLAGYGEQVFKLYKRMNERGIISDRFTYTYVLKACVVAEGSKLLLKEGKEIHGHILRHGYEDNVHVMTTLVDMYARYGCVSCAGHVFGEMRVKNVVSWSAMIACYANNGMAYEALELFRKMMAEECSDNVPNSVTMVSVLQACAALAALKQGRLIHGYILRRGLDLILPVVSALVSCDHVW